LFATGCNKWPFFDISLRVAFFAVINIANAYRQNIGVLFRSRQKVSLSESMSPFQTEN